MSTTKTAFAAMAAAAAIALTGCGGPVADAEAPAAAEDATGTAAESFSAEDAWVKAATEDDGMTGAFGILGNASGTDATVVSATASGAGMVELHEVVTGDDGNSVMREKEGGFTIPAGGTHVLEPGADHIMLMALEKDLEPGTEVAVALEFSDGSTAEFTAPVKAYEGANENYDGGHGDGHDDGHAEH
ncbi:copper chaperone PCu(A)C [Actinorugispora endophytica]|uniref:Copper(I)-binding protein n=1 Tax=Actinorugispora endophytica TaxID=1605990 RepID=A0A4R6UUQ6_9ACTN|nr:copper chaperone PCu(A)C [Actinorugispora endophytica]TDQ49996.1 hypothetical protein EV190_11440 [Actinorugispora endophytica]